MCAQVLRETRHNGFPVVRDSPGGQVLVGLVAREHLMVILRRALAAGARREAAPGDVAYEDLNRHFVSAAARSMISEQQLAVLQACFACLSCGCPSGCQVPWPCA
jgi:chloride channel 7